MREPNEELGESWFGSAVRVSEPPTSVAPRAPRPPVRVRSAPSAFALGAVAGVAGGAIALLLAGVSTRVFGPPLSVAEALGRGVGQGWEAGFAVAAAVGAVLGGLLALTMRHAQLWAGRLVFASIASVALWFCVHVALLARHHATLPLVPMLLGMAAYGLCVAAVPSSRGPRR